MAFFHVKQPKFENIHWFMSYTQILLKKWQNVVFTRNSINAEFLKKLSWKFDTQILKPATKFG